MGSGDAATVGPGCEVLADGLLREPVAAVSSLAFVVAGAVILARRRHIRRDDAQSPGDHPTVIVYAGLVSAVGLGSLVQHGPDPAWSDLAHDLPLLATLAFVAADAVAALTGRPRAWWWWVLPTGLLAPPIVVTPPAGDAAQVGVAVVAVGLTLLRARAFPPVRGPIVQAVALLAIGGTVGTLARAGGVLCDPHSLWQGHAVWHVLAALALVVLAPAVGHRVDGGPRSPRSASTSLTHPPL